MPERTKPAVGAAIILCLLAAMLEGFDIASMGVAAPRMVPALRLASDQAGWAFSASLFGLFIGAAFAGPLADRIGRKPVMIAAVAVYGLFSLATAFAPGYGALLAARAFTGIGLGGAMPMLIAVTSELVSARRRGAVVGLITAGLPLGGACVGLLARAAPEPEAWRLIFIVGGIAPLLLTLGLIVGVPETRTRPATGQSPPSVLATLFSRERLGATLCLWLSYAAIALVLHLFLNWLPTLVIARGFEPKAAAGISTLFNLGGALGGVLAGLAVDRMGFRWPLAAVFTALVVLLLALAAPSASLAATSALAFGAGFLIMAGQFGLYGLGPNYYPTRERGVGVGAAIAAGRLGSALGPLAAGELLKGGASGGQVVSATIPIVIIAGLAAMALSIVGRRAPD